ncbi:uncharacterized protein LOC135847447 [Planococcus citri]|uniref:uncharacterized protein LOC135847447 n=1 Tax=Planococcus citri TaxID=170843 RepID=UPI0031F867D0
MAEAAIFVLQGRIFELNNQLAAAQTALKTQICLRERAEINAAEYKKKYQKVVTPEVVRSRMVRLEQQCGSAFPYVKENYRQYTKNERTRRTREDRWYFMLTERADDPLLQSIVELLDPSQIRKFCKDLSNVYSIITDKIHSSKFEDPEELPVEYSILPQGQLNYAVDIIMSVYQPLFLDEDGN